MKLCRNGHDKDLPGGRRPNGKCGPCQSASQARYRAAHPERVRASQVAYDAAHPERKRAYYLVHREEALASQAAYRAAHPEVNRARCAAYYADHREEMLAWAAVYQTSPRGREVSARRKYTEWRKNIAQRLASRPSQIAALEAELERVLTNGT